MTAARRLAFDPNDMESWQARARRALAEMLGYRHAVSAVPTIAVTECSADAADGEAGLIRKTYYVRTRGMCDVPVTLIQANTLSEPPPVFLFLAGSTSGAHIGWGTARLPIDHQRIAIGADFARQAARRGYLAVCIEQIGFGERQEKDLPSRTDSPHPIDKDRVFCLGIRLAAPRHSSQQLSTRAYAARWRAGPFAGCMKFCSREALATVNWPFPVS